jgi:hypothetical protein
MALSELDIPGTWMGWIIGIISSIVSAIITVTWQSSNIRTRLDIVEKDITDLKTDIKADLLELRKDIREVRTMLYTVSGYKHKDLNLDGDK